MQFSRRPSAALNGRAAIAPVAIQSRLRPPKSIHNAALHSIGALCAEQLRGSQPQLAAAARPEPLEPIGANGARRLGRFTQTHNRRPDEAAPEPARRVMSLYLICTEAGSLAALGPHIQVDLAHGWPGGRG